MTDNLAQWRKDAEAYERRASHDLEALVHAERNIALLDLVEKARGLLGDAPLKIGPSATASRGGGYAIHFEKSFARSSNWLDRRDGYLSSTASIKDTTDEAG